MIPENAAGRISRWVAERVKSAGAEGVVVGMSGGMDSSVTAVLCKRAPGGGVLALLMPCHSDPRDSRHAELVAKKFNIKTETIDLSGAYDKILESLPRGDRISSANIKPRLRMLTLYYFANLKRCLVAGTSNKTEILTGYMTKYGDGGADIEPLGGLYKTQVMELAEQLGIPREIMDKEPSAGLWPRQTDEKELGIAYGELDAILEAIEKNKTRGIDKNRLNHVRGIVEKSIHKREVPPVCRL